MPVTPCVLIICDGWGEAPDAPGNAIAQAATPNFDALREKWLHTTVEASGEAVGLPAGQQGNSEVGHLTIGSGRIFRQPLSRQIHALESGAFYQNEVLINAIETAKQRGSSLHILGLISPGGVHSHSDGAIGLVKLSKQLGLTGVHVHAFTDGRDTEPTSAITHIEAFENELARIGAGKIRSLAGRYFAMDRDNNWDRIEQAYDVLVGQGAATAQKAQTHVAQKYEEGETDEFLRPTAITGPDDDRVAIKDDDVVVFFNFRPDRARQLSHALVDEEFTSFARKRVLKNLHFVSFAEYDPDLQVGVAFPKELMHDTLAETLSKQGKTQYHIAETEKYAHVTYFLNGGIEQPFEGEDRTMIPSPGVATYDMQPGMSAERVTDDVIAHIRSAFHDLIIVNYANADMVGHTGDLPATIKAIEVLDDCIGRVAEAVLDAGGSMLMTADHGNAERKIDENGKPVTSHSKNPVPVLVCGIKATGLHEKRGLQDIAPTICDMMRVDVPAAMTGTSLIKR